MADPVIPPVAPPTTTSMINTPPWLSKRVWLNVIMAVAGFFPQAQNFFSDNPQALMLIFSGANILLTFITKDKVSLSD